MSRPTRTSDNSEVVSIQVLLSSEREIDTPSSFPHVMHHVFEGMGDG